MSNCLCKARGNPIDNPTEFPEYFPEPFYYIEASSKIIMNTTPYAGMNIIEYSNGFEPIRFWQVIKDMGQGSKIYSNE
jgi:hypothetical protein